MKKIIVFGCFLAVFLILMVPSISAVEYSVTERANKKFSSRETQGSIDRFSRDLKSLFHIVSRFKSIYFITNSPLNIDSFILRILITGVVAPTIILLTGAFLEEILESLGCTAPLPMVRIISAFIFSLLMLLTEQLLEERYGSAAYSICALFIFIDALIATKTYDLVKSLLYNSYTCIKHL